jgi:hypothetical protein
MTEQYFPRKTFPTNQDNHGIINNPSGVPHQETTTFSQSAIIVLSNRNVCIDSTKFNIKRDKKRIRGIVVKVYKIAPVIKKEIKPIFITSVGGGRVGGGGTSKEAIRRVKRHIKLTTNHNHNHNDNE